MNSNSINAAPATTVGKSATSEVIISDSNIRLELSGIGAVVSRAKMNDSWISHLCNSIKNLYCDGDRNGRKAKALRQQLKIPLENRNLCLVATYAITFVNRDSSNPTLIISWYPSFTEDAPYNVRNAKHVLIEKDEAFDHLNKMVKQLESEIHLFLDDLAALCAANDWEFDPFISTDDVANNSVLWENLAHIKERESLNLESLLEKQKQDRRERGKAISEANRQAKEAKKSSH